MEKKIINTIKQYRLIKAKDTLVAAISGGPDSMALLYFLHKISGEWEIKIHVAHFNHMFRGEVAKAEALFVARTAYDMGLECSVETKNVPLYLEKTGLSPEEGGRKLRYEFFRELARKIKADTIATAHHADDQGETVLLHLLRGTGPEGLAAMSPRENNLIRPLLEVNKEEILAYCHQHKIEYCLDASNQEGIYTRNQVRWELIPHLEKYNPQITKALVKMADICRLENEYLIGVTKKIQQQLMIDHNNQGVSLDRIKTRALHPAIQRRLIRQVVDDFTGQEGYLSFDHTEKILKLKTGKIISLPGTLYAICTGRKLIFSWEKPVPGKIKVVKPVKLKVPGITYIPELNLKVMVELIKGSEFVFTEKGYTQVFSQKILREPLFLRNRYPGDRFRPQGMQGQKKLKDFFIDEKISFIKREQVPLILSGTEIIWVVGYRTGAGQKAFLGEKEAVQIAIKSC